MNMNIETAFGMAFLLVIVVLIIRLRDRGDNAGSKERVDPPFPPSVVHALRIIRTDKEFAMLLTNFNIEIVQDLTVADMGVVGAAYNGTIFLDEAYIKYAIEEDVISLILHELGHLVMGHTTQDPDDELAARRYASAGLKRLGY